MTAQIIHIRDYEHRSRDALSPREQPGGSATVVILPTGSRQIRADFDTNFALGAGAVLLLLMTFRFFGPWWFGKDDE